MAISCSNLCGRLSLLNHLSFQIKKNYILLVLLLALSSLMTKIETTPNSSPSHETSMVFSKTSTYCKDTLHMDSCESMLLSIENVHSKTPKELFDLSIKFTMAHAHSTRSLAEKLLHPMINTQLDQTLISFPAMKDCMELLDDILLKLDNILNPKTTSNDPDDIQTWLSTALTNQETCMDGLENKIYSYKYIMDSSAKNVSKFISNSLALYKHVMDTKDSSPSSSRGGGHRKLLSTDSFPTWVSVSDRKLLEASSEDLLANAVVAKDGTGTHTTIEEALASVPVVGNGKTVIHVKAGTYSENLNIPSSQKNVMLVGDGKGITIITGSKNQADGSTLLGTATFAATGDGFMARDITFQNTAGPAKHQAVALRVSSDKSVFYRCSIVGYQDSLYTLSNRQFFRETDIYGTVDFIFGNAAVVFQSCNIFPRKPLASQEKNFITAQGRSDPNQNTGISIHNCKITATSDLASSNIQTYLGRPWKAYSRTVIMQTFMDKSIASSGWFPWSGGSAPKTIYYGEYMNSGPGAATSGRVNWVGYHPSLTPAEATQFTVASLISGGQWLPATGVSFDSGLLG